jgi:transposase
VWELYWWFEMFGRPAADVHLSAEERARIEAHLRRESCTLAEHRRGRIALLAADGTPTTAIAKELRVATSTVSRWRGRLARDGLGEDVPEALKDEPRAGRPRTITEATRMQVIATACDPLPDAAGLSGWTLDLLVEEFGMRDIASMSRSSVHRILTEMDVQPHRQEMWLHSPDPEFVAKVADIVALYLQPPPGSVVVSFDEKTGIQAVERKHPDRPAQPGRLARREFEYIRHGTQSLLATLNVHTGDLIADCGPTRKGDDMEQHMERVAAHYPDVEVHVVLDNLNIHKGERWVHFNARHGGRFHFHYTPLHASWVNQIEIFFGVLARRCLRRKSFRTTEELRAHVMAFIARWNARDKKPFRWTFAGFPTKPAATVTVDRKAA